MLASKVFSLSTSYSVGRRLSKHYPVFTFVLISPFLNSKLTHIAPMSETNTAMTEEERNQQYRQMADSFISVANKHAEQQDPFMVSSAFLYAAARFSSFATAVQAKTLENYEADREPAIEYFATELRRMLGENLDDYRRVFEPKPEPVTMVHKYTPKKQQEQEAEQERFLTYDHLVKK